ncbi:MAG: helix-turn-helix domain-containing protein, partial [Gammaproteobacteria bacterium]
YRLNVARVELPPLRERHEDIPLLVDHFLARQGRSDVRLDSGTYARLLARPWAGNVRELQHVVERALLFAAGGEVDASALGLASSAISEIEPEVESGLPATTEGLTLDGMERRMISLALQATGGNVSEAARRLGISRMAMRYRMEKYGVK